MGLEVGVGAEDVEFLLNADSSPDHYLEQQHQVLGVLALGPMHPIEGQEGHPPQQPDRAEDEHPVGLEHYVDWACP